MPAAAELAEVGDNNRSEFMEDAALMVLRRVLGIVPDLTEAGAPHESHTIGAPLCIHLAGGPARLRQHDLAVFEFRQSLNEDGPEPRIAR